MRAVVVSLLVLSLAPVSAFADEAVSAKPAPLAAPVEQCIRDNAAKVEKAIVDLNHGVDFLINNLCAEPVALEQARQMRVTMEKQTAKWQEACDKQKASPKADAGAPTWQGMCSGLDLGTFMPQPSDENQDTYYTPERPAGAVSLASRLLLDLRLSHVKATK